jgi:hypothetical protein
MDTVLGPAGEVTVVADLAVVAPGRLLKLPARMRVTPARDTMRVT